MPNKHIDDLRSDADHMDKQRGTSGASTSEPTQNKPKPSDLGTGAAKGAAEAILKRKALLDSI